MQQFNNFIELLNEDVLNGTGEKTAKVLLMWVFIVFLTCTVISICLMFFSSIVLLLQSFLTGHISYQNSIFNGFGISQGIKEFNYRCLWLIGYLLLVISLLVKSINMINKGVVPPYKYSYISFVPGILVVLWSVYPGISQSFITFDSGEDISQLLIMISLIGFIFASVEEKYAKRKKYFVWTTIIASIIHASYL